MSKDKDYWLENISLEQSIAYVEGDMKTVRNDEKFNFGKANVFDTYQQLAWGYNPETRNNVPGLTRLSRKGTNGTFYLLTPHLGKQVAAGEISYQQVKTLDAPHVIRVDIDRLKSGATLMTYAHPLTRQLCTSGRNVQDAMPWLSFNWYISMFHGGLSNLQNMPEEEEKKVRSLSNSYGHALLLKFFTIDLDYDLQKDIMPMATAKLGFEQKLDLLRGEFLAYKSQGMHGSLMRELLPQADS